MSSIIPQNLKTSYLPSIANASSKDLQIPYETLSKLYLFPEASELQHTAVKERTAINIRDFSPSIAPSSSLQGRVQTKSAAVALSEMSLDPDNELLQSYFVNPGGLPQSVKIADRQAQVKCLQTRDEIEISKRIEELSRKFNCELQRKDVAKIASIVLQASSVLFKESNVKKLEMQFPGKPFTFLKKKACDALIKKILLFKVRSQRPFNGKLAFVQEKDKIFLIGYQKILGNGGFNTAILVDDIEKEKLRVYRKLKECGNESLKIEAEYEAYLHQSMQQFPPIAKGIVHLKAIANTKKSFGLVLEYCNGGNLAEKYQEFSPEIKKSLILPLFHTLSSLHDEGFVHADFKEDNVLLTFDGKWHPKLADFGKSFTEKSPIYRGGDCRFMSPESFYDDTAKTEKIDSWAAGLFLYKMKYYKTPSLTALFKKLGMLKNSSNLDSSPENRHELEVAIESGLQKFIQKLDLNDPYDQLIVNMLKLNPEERFSCKQACEALKNIPASSFGINETHLVKMGYYLPDVSKEDALKRLRANMASQEWCFPQCAIIKEEKDSSFTFIFTKANETQLKACYSECVLGVVNGVLSLSFNSLVIPIGKVINKYFRLI